MRPYKNLRRRAGVEVTAYFGRELEATPAFGLPTLFLVGRHTIPDISSFLDQCPIGPRHIYFGANQSFDGAGFEQWVSSMQYCLKEGFWCSLSFRASFAQLVATSGLCRRARFIPVVVARIPCVASLGTNAHLKVDDLSFRSTNPGTWMFRLMDLAGGTSFVSWDHYEAEDSVIAVKVKK